MPDLSLNLPERNRRVGKRVIAGFTLSVSDASQYAQQRIAINRRWSAKSA